MRRTVMHRLLVFLPATDSWYYLLFRMCEHCRLWGIFREPGAAFQPINVIGVPNLDQTVLKAYKTVPIEPAGIEIN